MKKLALSLLILLVAVPAFAQRGPGECVHAADCGQVCLAQAHDPMGHGHGGRHMDGPPQKMVEGFRLFKLTEFLELTEKQTEKIYPAMAEMNNLRDEHREKMQAKMKSLRELIDEERIKEAAKLAEEIHDMRGDIHALMHEKQGDLMKLLTEEQRAKYVLFNKRFEGHLKQVAHRLHGRVGERGPRDGEKVQRRRGPGGK